MTRWIARPAARNDAAELVRLARGFGWTDKASELDAALRAVAGRLAMRGDIEGLIPLLGLPDCWHRPPAEDPGVKELISLGPLVEQAVMDAARYGGDLTRMRSLAVLEAVGAKQAADDVRRLLDGPERLPGFLPSGHSQVASHPGGYAGGALTTFRPRRWRVFALLSVIMPVFFAFELAILYALDPWRSWHDGPVFIACAFILPSVGIQTWRAPENYAVSVSDTEIIGWPAGWAVRTIPLADLDRVRSARRGPIDRILGRQHFYSTSGKRIYLWRAAFDRSDLRKLLGLLQLDQGHLS